MADPERFGDNQRGSPSPLGSPLEALLCCLSTSSSSDSSICFPVSSPILILTPPDSYDKEEEENQAEGDATEATPGTYGVNHREKLVTGDCPERDSSGAVALRRETELLGFSCEREAESKARDGRQAKVLIPFEPDASLSKLRRILKSTVKELKIGEKNMPEGKSMDGSKSATATVEIIQASGRNFGSAPARIRMRSLEESESGSPSTEEAQICQKNVDLAVAAAETNIVSMKGCKASFNSPSAQIRMRLLEESGSPTTEEAQICQKKVDSAAAAETNIVSMKVCEASFSSPSAQIRTSSLKSLEKSRSPKGSEPQIHEQIVIPGMIKKAKSTEGLKTGAPAIGITNVSPQDPETNFNSDAARIQISSLVEESGSPVTEEAQLCQENAGVAAAVETNNAFMKACKASFSSPSAQVRTSSLKYSENPDSPAEEAQGIFKKKISSGLVVTEVEDSLALSDIPVDSTMDNTGGQGQPKLSTKRKLELCPDIVNLATTRAEKRSYVPDSDRSRYNSSYSGSRTDEDDEHGRRKIPPKVALLLKVLKICAKDDECRLPKPETTTSLVEIAKMRGMTFPLFNCSATGFWAPSQKCLVLIEIV